MLSSGTEKLYPHMILSFNSGVGCVVCNGSRNGGRVWRVYAIIWSVFMD